MTMGGSRRVPGRSAARGKPLRCPRCGALVVSRNKRKLYRCTNCGNAFSEEESRNKK
jgi:ribosomal protein L37AE/L43A